MRPIVLVGTAAMALSAALLLTPSPTAQARAVEHGRGGAHSLYKFVDSPLPDDSVQPGTKERTPALIWAQDEMQDVGAPDAGRCAQYLSPCRSVFPCCPGLICVAGATRHFCVPAPCTTPSSPGVRICYPKNGSTEGSPVTVEATAKVTGEIDRMELWVDGKKTFTVFGISYFFTQPPVSLASGNHRFAVWAINTAGKKWVTVVYATVR